MYIHLTILTVHQIKKKNDFKLKVQQGIESQFWLYIFKLPLFNAIHLIPIDLELQTVLIRVPPLMHIAKRKMRLAY